MAVAEKVSSCERAVSMLPCALRCEIMRILAARRGGYDSLREIRVRAEGVCSLVLSDERIRLLSRCTLSDMAQLMHSLTDGALYAHKDNIAEGYITLDGGVRVGLAGYARYEGGSVVGVSDIRYALFRFPMGECAVREELYDAFCTCKTGMLIYSPPGVGKTTALRALAGDIGRRDGRRRVTVIDERCEFIPEDYSDAEVDILRGYKRREGLDIAVRTMSAEVLMIDELGAEDAPGVARAVRCGIPLVATAHAGSFEELTSRPSLSALFECGAFDVFAGISRNASEYSLTVNGK